MTGFRFNPTLLLMSIARPDSHCPVCEADRHTSMADARTAICLAAGVAIDDIDPASGYDLSHRAYRRARASWIDLIRQHGADEFYSLPNLAEARAYWAEKRPEFIVGDDWATEAFEAHRQFIAALGGSCRKASCVVHYPLSAEPGSESGDLA
ncbi:hypothetical protein ACGF12_30265 [Kitasatospora sp. NPDC048296]|uniref:hypothetical protein n=1 Tax=Kitasatospora sp. NPDC048296 TaxID=3364048 RepID=UPI00371017A9